MGLGVSCSADRQVKGKITSEGVFLEQLETDVGQYLPEVTESDLLKHDEKGALGVVEVDINKPMDELR